MDKQIKNINFSMLLKFKNLLILVKILIDFEILSFMYVIWSDQFNLLLIITPKKIVLLTLTKLFSQRCILSSGALFLILVQWNELVSL